MSDLISREAVIDIIQKEMESVTDYLQHDVLINVEFETCELPTVEVPQWIPCSERLPEQSGEYLVWYDCGEDMEGCCFENFDSGVGAFGRWIDEYDGYTLGFLDSEFIYSDEAVAWMPLPEPYKGE